MEISRKDGTRSVKWLSHIDKQRKQGSQLGRVKFAKPHEERMNARLGGSMLLRRRYKRCLWRVDGSNRKCTSFFFPQFRWRSPNQRHRTPRNFILHINPHSWVIRMNHSSSSMASIHPFVNSWYNSISWFCNHSIKLILHTLPSKSIHSSEPIPVLSAIL